VAVVRRDGLQSGAPARPPAGHEGEAATEDGDRRPGQLRRGAHAPGPGERVSSLRRAGRAAEDGERALRALRRRARRAPCANALPAAPARPGGTPPHPVRVQGPRGRPELRLLARRDDAVRAAARGPRSQGRGTARGGRRDRRPAHQRARLPAAADHVPRSRAAVPGLLHAGVVARLRRAPRARQPSELSPRPPPAHSGPERMGAGEGRGGPAPARGALHGRRRLRAEPPPPARRPGAHPGPRAALARSQPARADVLRPALGADPGRGPARRRIRRLGPELARQPRLPAQPLHARPGGPVRPSRRRWRPCFRSRGPRS
jgi:hypothetical protein